MNNKIIIIIIIEGKTLMELKHGALKARMGTKPIALKCWLWLMELNGREKRRSSSSSSSIIISVIEVVFLVDIEREVINGR